MNVCSKNNLQLDNLTYSPITGATGNIEFLAHLVKETNLDVTLSELQIKEIIENAHKRL